MRYSTANGSVRSMLSSRNVASGPSVSAPRGQVPSLPRTSSSARTAVLETTRISVTLGMVV